MLLVEQLKLPYITFNNDTASNYANRYNKNGAGDATSASRANLFANNTAGAFPMFTNMFIINNSSNEKLVIGNLVAQNTAGAGTAPDRQEFFGKWANTSAQITEIDFTNVETGDFGTNSIIKVWGSD
jgi:hypothetical protein